MNPESCCVNKHRKHMHAVHMFTHGAVKTEDNRGYIRTVRS